MAGVSLTVILQEENLIAAVLLEQAALNLLHLKHPAVRKWSFHLVLAALRFSNCQQPRLANRAYRSALPCLQNKAITAIEHGGHRNMRCILEACKGRKCNVSSTQSGCMAGLSPKLESISACFQQVTPLPQVTHETSKAAKPLIVMQANLRIVSSRIPPSPMPQLACRGFQRRVPQRTSLK